MHKFNAWLNEAFQTYTMPNVRMTFTFWILAVIKYLNLVLQFILFNQITDCIILSHQILIGVKVIQKRNQKIILIIELAILCLILTLIFFIFF